MQMIFMSEGGSRPGMDLIGGNELVTKLSTHTSLRSSDHTHDGIHPDLPCSSRQKALPWGYHTPQMREGQASVHYSAPHDS